MTAGRRFRFLPFLFILGILSVLAAHAEDQSAAADTSLEDLMKVKVSTASRYLQPVTDAPSFVTIITADQIQRFGYRTLADALQSVGGFFVTYDRNYSYVGVRGFSRPGDYNTKILLLVNGHRMNDALYDSALIGTEFPLDMDLVQRIEVIRGPGASLYGSDAFFAVINVILRTPERGLPTVEASFDSLSYGGLKGRLTYSRLVHGWELMASASVFHDDGQELFFPEFDTAATNYGVTRGTDYDSSYSTFFHLAKARWRIEGLYGSRDKGIPTGAFETDFNNPGNHTIDDRGYLEVTYARDIGKWNVTLRGSYDGYSYVGSYINPPDEQGIRVVDHDFTRTDTVNGDVQIGRRLARKHFVTAGSDIRNSPRVYQENYYVSPRVVWVDDARSVTVCAAYVQDEYSITRWLLANGGVRIDHYSTFGSTVNPRLAFILKPRSATNVKVIYGSAFRAPNSYELYYTTALYEASKKLLPESIQSTEVVIEHSFSQHWHASGSLFHNRISGLISEAVDASDGSISYRNSEDAHAAGADAQIGAHLDNGISASAAYTYVTARHSLRNEPLSNSPHTLLKLGISAPMVRRWATASLAGNFVSRRGTLAGSSVPPYFRLDMTLLAKQVRGGLQVSASVYNLANTRYWDPGAEEHVQDRLSQDGRAFRLKLTYAFGTRH